MINNNNGTMLKISIGSIVPILLAIIFYFNVNKLDADVYEIQKEWDQSQFLSIREDLKEINGKIDLLLSRNGVSKSEIKKKLEEI